MNVLVDRAASELSANEMKSSKKYAVSEEGFV